MSGSKELLFFLNSCEPMLELSYKIFICHLSNANKY